VIVVTKKIHFHPKPSCYINRRGCFWLQSRGLAMLETDTRCCDDNSEVLLDGGRDADVLSDKAAWDARRRIERLRELRRLRDLLGDPEFNELD
jgi:hypothetical protein